jgi:methylmalonyl-CoA/ethylmalonyl-CoA epimerase
MKLHHVGIIAHNFESTMAALSIINGAPSEITDQKDVAAFECTCYLVGQVEIVVPYGGSLLRFLEERGSSLHHIALEVADVRAHADYLRRLGVPVVFDNPTEGVAGLLVNFVHFSHMGVLVEIVEVPHATT